MVDPEKKEVEVMALREKGYEIVGVYKKDEKLKSPLLKGPAVNLNGVFK